MPRNNRGNNRGGRGRRGRGRGRGGVHRGTGRGGGGTIQPTEEEDYAISVDSLGNLNNEYFFNIILEYSCTMIPLNMICVVYFT